MTKFSAVVIVFGWLAVQIAIIGYVSWMQPATAIAGLFILILAWLLAKSDRRAIECLNRPPDGRIDVSTACSRNEMALSYACFSRAHFDLVDPDCPKALQLGQGVPKEEVN